MFWKSTNLKEHKKADLNSGNGTLKTLLESKAEIKDGHLAAAQAHT